MSFENCLLIIDKKLANLPFRDIYSYVIKGIYYPGSLHNAVILQWSLFQFLLNLSYKKYKDALCHSKRTTKSVVEGKICGNATAESIFTIQLRVLHRSTSFSMHAQNILFYQITSSFLSLPQHYTLPA